MTILPKNTLPYRHPRFSIVSKRVVSAALAVTLSASLMMGSLSSAVAITQADIDATKAQITQMQSQQAELESQKADVQSQLDVLASQENDALEELLLYQQQVELLESQIANTNALIEEYAVEIEVTTQELAEAEAKEAEYYQLYCDRVRAMEEGGRTSYWSVLLSSSSFSDLLDRINTISAVMDYDNDVMDWLADARQEVADTKARLEDEKAQQEEALAVLEDQEAQAQAAYDAVDALLQEIHENQDLYADKMAELDTLTAELEQDIVTTQATYENQVAELQRQIEEEKKRKEEEERKKKEAAAAAAAAAANRNNSSSSSSGSSSSGITTDNSNAGSYISSSTGSALGAEIAAYACQFVGNPYVWGGTSLTNGADCSGFVMSVYKHFGYSLPHSSLSMRKLGVGVSYENAQPGDLICYYSSGSPTGGHVGIYIGGGMMVNALSSKYGIVINKVNTSRSGLVVRRII